VPKKSLFSLQTNSYGLKPVEARRKEKLHPARDFSPKNWQEEYSVFSVHSSNLKELKGIYSESNIASSIENLGTGTL